MIKEKVITLIKDRFSIDQVTEETNLRNDFDIDSIAMLEFVMEIEEEFNVEIEDDDLQKFETVGDVIQYLEK